MDVYFVWIQCYKMKKNELTKTSNEKKENFFSRLKIAAKKRFYASV